MKSLTVLRDDIGHNKTAGFTLIEILVVMGTLALLFASSHFINLDSYSRKLLEAEHASLVSVLQKARSRSMNNVFSASHGVHIGPAEYIIFRKHPFDPTEKTNEEISRNPNIAITGLTEIPFEELSGEPSLTGEIVLNDGIRTKKINIIMGGLIDW